VDNIVAVAVDIVEDIEVAVEIVVAGKMALGHLEDKLQLPLLLALVDKNNLALFFVDPPWAKNLDQNRPNYKGYHCHIYRLSNLIISSNKIKIENL
jgi:hypothetical protein